MNHASRLYSFYIHIPTLYSSKEFFFKYSRETRPRQNCLVDVDFRGERRSFLQRRVESKGILVSKGGGPVVGCLESRRSTSLDHEGESRVWRPSVRSDGPTLHQTSLEVGNRFQRKSERDFLSCCPPSWERSTWVWVWCSGTTRNTRTLHELGRRQRLRTKSLKGSFRLRFWIRNTTTPLGGSETSHPR